MFYFARGINIVFNSLVAQLVKYNVHTTRKLNFIHAIFITYYCFLYIHTYIHTYTYILRILMSF